MRISPGTIVVTVMPCCASSTAIPSEKPTAANFAQLYGSRCGTLTLPPIEVMLAIRPCLRACIWGSTASVG